MHPGDPFAMDFRLGATNRGQQDQQRNSDYPETDQEEEEAYVSYTERTLKERRDTMGPTYAEWRRNIRMLDGHQWLEYDQRTNTWVDRRSMKKADREKEDAKEYPVINHLSIYHGMTMARMTKNKPTTNCVPTDSTDVDNVSAAAFGNKVLEGKWVELDRAAVLRQLVAWLVPTGNSILWPVWDPRGGKMKEMKVKVATYEYDEMTQMPVAVRMMDAPVDANGEPIMKESPWGQQVYDMDARPHRIEEGEICDRVISPFMFFPDNDIISDKDMRSAIIVELISVKEAEMR